MVIWLRIRPAQCFNMALRRNRREIEGSQLCGGLRSIRDQVRLQEW